MWQSRARRHLGRQTLISITMLWVFGISISVNKLSKLPAVVRLGADNRLVAG
jgi:hypothetical protein